MGFPSGSTVKNQPGMQETKETQVRSLGLEDPLEEDLAWRIPWAEEPGGVYSIGSQRVGHDSSD